MRINRLRIGEFRNLKDFEISFNSESPYAVLVGQNGSGKSNILEAILQIFDTLERRATPPFKYSIAYTCRSQVVELDCDPSKARFKTVAHLTPISNPELRKRIPVEKLYGDIRAPLTRYLPEFVFGYYSGVCERFPQAFRAYQKRYTDLVRQAPSGTPVPRRFLYGLSSFYDLVLVALWGHSDAGAPKKGLLNSLGINTVKNIRLQLKPASRYNPEVDEPRSLGLKGLLRDFVNEIDLAVIDGETRSSGEGKDLRKDCAISDDGLRKLATFATQHQTNLFSLLLQLQEEEVLSECSCVLSLRDSTAITPSSLSEGEKQLLLVMGTIRFSEHEEALYLLDEPDTHLNPVWSLQYLKLAEDELGRRPMGQILMATHDPFMFAGLAKTDVRILNCANSDAKVTVDVPSRDPKGAGVAAILMSDMFGLQSIFDLETQRLLDEKRSLAIKDMRKPEETERLKELNSILRDVDVSLLVSDPLYSLFVRTLVRRKEYDQLRNMFLGAEDVREKLGKSVVDELLALGGKDAVH